MKYSEIMQFNKIRRKKIKKINKFTAFFMMIIFIAVSCGKKDAEAEYEVTEIKTGDISLSVSKTGQVVSDNEISVYTTSSQRVNKVFFKKGDNVKKGDVVLTFYPIDKNEKRREITKKSLEVQQKQRDLYNARELYKVGGESKVNVDNARIALETSQLELASLQEDLSLIVDQITSPVDGVITEMTADENYRVNTESTLFKVSDSENMRVEVNLSDSDIKNIAVDQRVEITSDSLPNGEKIEGYVSQIAGVAEKSSTLDESNTVVKIKMNETKGLKPGATITATIFYKESKNVIKLPYSSVINENGKYYAFIVDKDNKVMKKEIKVGINDDSYYEILSGISSGNRVITVADEALKDGQKIKIADPSKTNNKNKNKNAKSKNSRQRGGGGPGGPRP